MTTMEASPKELANTLLNATAQIIKGKASFLENMVCAMVAGGHVLLDDMPGTGKTSVAKTMAKLIGNERNKPLDFKRIQFTPDLLPYDITGVDIYNPEKKTFTFSKGPVFAHIVLADEINRTTPKVQSALLEVMAEQQVSSGTKTHQLPEPFIVIATQNPIDSEGTWHLPEAQLDRFMMKLSLGYPSREAELSILQDDPSNKTLPKLKPCLTLKSFLALKKKVDTVHCSPELMGALADIVRMTRNHPAVRTGASPRAGLHYLKAIKAKALIRGRDYVTDQDLEDLAIPCLAHRIRLKDASHTPEQLIRELLLEQLKAFTPS